MSKKTSFFIFTSLIVLMLGSFAQYFFVSAIFPWYLKNYCSDCLHSNLTYKAFHYQNGTWVVEQPVFSSSIPLENGGHHLQADRATIIANTSWLNRRIDLNILLDNPHFNVGHGALELKKLIDLPSENFNLFTVHTELDVPKGILHFHDSPDQDPEKPPVYFSINMMCKDIKHGCLSLWMDHKTKSEEKKDLDIHFTELDGNRSQLTINATEVCCKDIQTALKHLWPKFEAFEIFQGSLNGSATLHLNQLQSMQGEGNFTFHDLALYNSTYEVAVNLPTLTITLSPEKNEMVPGSVGHLKIPEDSTLKFYKNGTPYWTIHNLNGDLSLRSDGAGQLDFKADYIHQDKEQKLHIYGRSDKNYGQRRKGDLHIELARSIPDQNASLSFEVEELKHAQHVIESKIQHITKEEFDFIHNLCSRTSTFWKEVALNDGVVDATMQLYFDKFNLSLVNIKHLQAQNLNLKFYLQEMSCGAEELQGTCSLNFAANEIWQTINSDLKISKGYVSLAGPSEEKWKFSTINTDLAIRKGIIQNTIIKTSIAGLTGEIQIDGNGPNEIARLEFKGPAIDLPDMFPADLRQNIEKQFGDSELNITAAVTRGYSGASVKGSVLITDPTNDHSDTIDIGFTLERPNFALKNGWFKSRDIPLEKFISPFLFLKDQMKLSGRGEFEGHFNSQHITGDYTAKDIILENEDFCIDVKTLSSLPETSHAPLLGNFKIDLQNNRCITHFPVFNGTYFEKNSGLLFYDVNANVVMEDDKAHLTDVEGFSNGIFFAGNIELDWSMPGDGVFEIDLFSHEMQGKVSQIQNFLSHFDKSLFFLKLPIEGNVNLQKDGGRLHFSFSPNDYILQSNIFASMSEGSIKVPSGEVSIQELSLDTHYDHQSNLLDFSDIQGTMLVGSPNHLEEYAISSDRICFTDFANNQSMFDIWVENQKHELLRIAGSTHAQEAEGHSHTVDFVFDKQLTHFGGVHPTIFNLTLKDWADVESFRLDFNFNLQTLLTDLQRFSRTGFFFLSRSALKEINEIKTAEGDFTVNLAYDNQKGITTYEVVGNEVAINDHSSNEFLFNGKKKGNTWIIDQLQIDDISLAADILKESEIWKVNFLGMRLGKSLLLGMEGHYNDESSVVNAKINLLEADLAYLDEWPSLKAIFEEHQLTGQVRAQGTMDIVFDKTLPQNMQLNAHLNCSLRNGKWHTFHFKDFDNASIDYTSDKGICLKNINTALRSAKNEIPQASIYLQSMNNDFINNEILIDSLLFQVPAKNLTWLSENLQQSFPDQVSPALCDIIQHCKSQGDVKGQLKFEFSQPHTAFRLMLDDDCYHFMDRDHDLSEFVLEYDPFELKISSKYKFERHQFWLTARSPTPNINKGEIILSEQILTAFDGSGLFPLTINWELDPSHGLIINKIEGTLCGFNCNLIKDTFHPHAADQLFLTGEIQANLAKARALISPELAGICSNWEIGQGYGLKGQWALTKDNRPFNESLTFQGELIGRNFEVAGYQFFHMSGTVGYSGNALRAANVSLQDPSAHAHINEIMLSKKGEGHWSIDIPSLTLNNFRPSLLHVRGELPPTTAKSLVVKQLDLQDFKGTLGERTSYSGKGRMLFANPPKRNLQNTIFALPAELLKRLGLDFGVLNPVRGTIFYEIKDSKIALTRFKDVYSKGKLSKFYLSNSGNPSYMDFDGNLSLQIRMKQYNLFFKFAELFTVTVQGHIKKPTYSLQRQN